MKQLVRELIEKAFLESCHEGLLVSRIKPDFVVEVPKNKAHGDFATNIAMLLAAREKKPPREVAEILSGKIKKETEVVKQVQVAGPGFINLFLQGTIWQRVLEQLQKQGDLFGSSCEGNAQKVQIEFVSANPTGPLHVGHGRGAAIGDALANILQFCGYEVTREYYINDVGSQMQNLGKSVYLRYLELLNQRIQFPEFLYQGGYIVEIAKEVILKYGNRFIEVSESEAISFFTEFASSIILKWIKDDLHAFGVCFDLWFSEKTLFDGGDVQAVIEELRKTEMIYEQDGAVWFKTTRFGDEKDRVIIKEDGTPTYFASDIAYHRDKFKRGFEKVINIWGADHHGYIPRIKGALQSFGIAPESFSVILVQMVNLLRSGKPVAMSTRAGEFVTLRQVIDEVGSDAARFIFLSRRSDAQLDFDLEVAKKQSDENPVYYVQYGHARICSIISFAAEKGLQVPSFSEIDVRLLSSEEESDLIKKIAQFPEVVSSSAHAFEPHRITVYLLELVALFHSYYSKYRVISDNNALSKARLHLINGIRCVLKNGLILVGVCAPEKM